MIKLSKSVDYALVILSHLYRHRDLSISATEISRKYDLSESFVAKVLKKLSKSDILESTQGVKGGYKVNTAPELITVKQLVFLLEGPISLMECELVEGNSKIICKLSEICYAKSGMQTLGRQIENLLSNFTLADILQLPKWTDPMDSDSSDKLSPVTLNERVFIN